MICDEARELQGNYIDRELIQPMRSRVDVHLATCPECAADFAAVAVAVERAKAERTAPDVAPWFADRVLDRLARDNETTNIFEGEDDPSQLTFRGI